MAYISFQHKDTIQSSLRRGIMASGSGGEFVHCEIVLSQFGNLICSSWHPKGVEIRQYEPKLYPNLWENFDLGSVDNELYQYFLEKKGTLYTLPGLLVNMIFNANVQSSRSFCSQICYEALKYTNRYNLPEVVSSSISPQDLKAILETHNFNPITSWQ